MMCNSVSRLAAAAFVFFAATLTTGCDDILKAVLRSSDEAATAASKSSDEAAGAAAKAEAEAAEASADESGGVMEEARDTAIETGIGAAADSAGEKDKKAAPGK